MWVCGCVGVRARECKLIKNTGFSMTFRFKRQLPQAASTIHSPSQKIQDHLDKTRAEDEISRMDVRIEAKPQQLAQLRATPAWRSRSLADSLQILCHVLRASRCMKYVRLVCVITDFNEDVDRDLPSAIVPAPSNEHAKFKHSSQVSVQAQHNFG